VAIGVGVGVGLGVPLLCLIAALIYYFSCRKPAQKRTSRENLSPVGPTSDTA
jgi:hypothetical protein